VLYMALADGVSRVRTGPLTLHTRTAVKVAEMFTDAKFSLEEETDDGCVLVCQGVGFKRK